jgi:hypothetical protein
MKKIYHYTKGYKIPEIIRSNEIMREGETGNYMTGIPSMSDLLGIKRVVWLTAETEMPFTATPVITNEFGEMPYRKYQLSRWRGYKHWAHVCDGVYRLAFDAEEIGAQRYCKGPIRGQMLAHGILSKFEQAARLGKDDIKKWYHCDERINLRHLKGIETWQGRWVPWDPMQSAQQVAA